MAVNPLFCLPTRRCAPPLRLYLSACPPSLSSSVLAVIFPRRRLSSLSSSHVVVRVDCLRRSSRFAGVVRRVMASPSCAVVMGGRAGHSGLGLVDRKAMKKKKHTAGGAPAPPLGPPPYPPPPCP